MKRRDMSTLSLVTQLGLTVVTALVLSLLLGIWLDGLLNTKPWLTLAFSMFGIIVGTVGVYRLVTRAIADSVERTPRTRSAGSGAKPTDAADSTSRRVDLRADEDDWDRDPWEDDGAAERRARKEEAERQLGVKPPKVNPKPPEEEQK